LSVPLTIFTVPRLSSSPPVVVPVVPPVDVPVDVPVVVPLDVVVEVDVPVVVPPDVLVEVDVVPDVFEAQLWPPPLTPAISRPCAL
jgi:hypothetical protein